MLADLNAAHPSLMNTAGQDSFETTIEIGPGTRSIASWNETPIVSLESRLLREQDASSDP